MEATTTLELEEEELPTEVRERLLGTAATGLTTDRGQTPRVGVHLMGATHVGARPATEAVATTVVAGTGHLGVPRLPRTGAAIVQEAAEIRLAATQEPTARPT